MAHNLATVNGQVSMWMKGKTEDAWHKLGQRTDTAQTWEAASDLAGLSYPVAKFQLDYQGRPVEAWGIFRTDNMEMLGSVGAGYAPFQNRNAFKTVDILMEAENGAHYDSAGALGKGEVIWCSAKVPCDFEVVPGDRVDTYLMFTTAHDGSRSSVCKLTAVQAVCANTLQMALSGAGEFFRVKHTKNAEERIMRAAELMKGVGNNVEALKGKLQKLAAVRMTRETMITVLDRLFPKPKNEDACTTRRDNILADVLRLYEFNNGNAFPACSLVAPFALPRQTRHQARHNHQRAAREMLAQIGNEMDPILPGMADHVAKQQEGAAQVSAEKLTQDLSRPLADITQAAGQMETLSPLFRGTAASNQKELF
jgi:phage/plasmid-like protein (TIGR03299 family)